MGVPGRWQEGRRDVPRCRHVGKKTAKAVLQELFLFVKNS